MRACAWMSQEGADAVCGFRREDVFEPAGLLGDFFFVLHLKCMREQDLCQAVTANDIFGATPSFFGEYDHPLAMIF